MKNKSNKNQKSRLERYFKQKSVPIRDIVLGIILAGGLIVWWYFFYPAIYVAILGGIGLIISRSLRIKDDEVDSLITKLEKDNAISVDEDKCSRVFDLRILPIAKGKDGKLRTSRYCLCEFDICGEQVKISVAFFDLLTQEVTKREYLLTNTQAELCTEEIMTPVGRKKISCITYNLFSEDIPIDLNNINVSNLVEKCCR